MPSNRRLRTRERHSAELTKYQREYLLTGCYLAHGEAFATPETERQAWRDNRESLMAEWFTQEPQLFCRPWAWWIHDASEGRRLLSGEVSSSNGRDWYGTPSAGDAEVYETQFAFLWRHPELWTPAERRVTLSKESIRWRQMPASEMADTSDYIRSKNYRGLLSADEL